MVSQPPAVASDPGTGRRARASTLTWALLLAVLSLLAASPGLWGGFIHDDLQMQGNPHYSGLGDVLAVFGRHSGDYAKKRDNERDGAMSRTYRPVAMLTLVAAQALSPTPGLHHLLGWLLHLITAALFFAALRRSDPRASSQRAHRFIAALFLLHPVGVESYVWINGRSDLLGGLCLAGLLFVLGSDGARSPKALASVFGITLLGSASKETFAPAALLLVIALCLTRGDAAGPAQPGSRAGVSAVLATLLGIAGYVVARIWVVPATSASLGQGGSPLASASGWLLIPKLGAIASYALLSLRAAAMQSLGWSLFRDLSVGEWISGLLALVALLALVLRRDFRGVMLMAAAGACAVPVILVVYVLWLGLDRYLYMPLLLLLFAASPYLVEASAFIERRTPRLWPILAGGILAVALANTFVASRAYRSQALWLSTLADERPDDPTTMMFLVKELGEPAANVLLQHFPAPPWPRSTIVPLIAFSLASGQASLAHQAAEYGLARYPDNLLIVAHAFRLRYLAGEKAKALAMLPALAGDPALCDEVQSQLKIWAKDAAAVDRERLDAAVAGMRCHATP